MTKKSVFDCKTYKTYLFHALGGYRSRTGLRTKAADYIRCQTAYLSKVLNDDADLSLEQAILMSEFLGHDTEENDFFLLLVQKGRSGSNKLAAYYEKKIQSQLEQRLEIRSRIKAQDSLSTDDQAIYYSKWYYSCIHVMVSIPTLNTKAALTEHLKLPAELISESLDFLESRGLVVGQSGRYHIGPRHLHLANNSPYISKHHANWRTRALHSMDVPNQIDLHYSVVVTLSKEDVTRLKSNILDMIQENMKIVKESKEECTLAIGLDFFQV